MFGEGEFTDQGRWREREKIKIKRGGRRKEKGVTW